MSFTIVDYLEQREGEESPRTSPYKWSLKDYEELKEGAYLKTKDSFERVCRRISEELELDTKNRKRENVDRRNYLIDILINKAKLTTTRTGTIFSRDHSTIIHSLKSFKILKDDKDFQWNVKILSDYFSKFELILEDLKRCKCGKPLEEDSFCSKKCKEANENKSFKNYSTTLSVSLNAPDDLEAVNKSIEIIEQIKELQGNSSILVDVFERSTDEIKSRAVDITEQLNIILTNNNQKK